MKTIKVLLFAVAATLLSFTPGRLSSAACHAVIKNASIQWKQVEINLGEIEQNKPATVNFEFKNTGEVPVIITSVQASCGCTATNYSKTPVAPGQSSQITATYNAAAKGNFKKTVTVITNASDASTILTITGSVI